MILLTGGAGFIGSVLARELNLAGREDLVIVDRLHDGKKWLNLRGIKFEEYYHADELMEHMTEDFVEELSFIIHLGACSSTTERDVDYLMKNNVAYSQALFSLACEQDIPIIYASSAATYGDGELGYSDDHKDIPKLRPLNPYGFSKQLFDEWVLKHPLHPSHWYGVKFFNVFGPNEYHKADMRSMVHKAFEQISESGQVKLFKSHKNDFKDGEQLRDFIYVKDVARALMMMMKKKGQGILNLGTGKARSFNDLVEAVFKSLDRPLQIEYSDMPVEIRSQYQYFTQAKMDKFNRMFPQFKFSSLEEGVSDYVKNYLVSSDPNY